MKIKIIKFFKSISLLFPLVVFGTEDSHHQDNHLHVHVQDVRPYAYLDGTQSKGPILDSLNHIQQYTHRAFETTLVPHKRIMNELDMMHAHLIIAFDGERIQGVQPIASLVEFDVSMTIRSDKNFDKIIKDEKAAIAVVRGTYIGLDALSKNTHFVEVKNYEQGLSLLQKNRVDAVMGIQEEIERSIRLLDVGEKSNIGTTHIVSTINAVIYVPNEHNFDPYVKEIKAAVETMKRKGILNPIFSDVFTKKPQSKAQ